MVQISDEYMKEMLGKAKPYTILILKNTPKKNNNPDSSKPIVWEHGRRNFQLISEGKLLIVCPVNDGTDVSGIGIFSCSVEETTEMMKQDPAVQAGLFTFEIHPTMSFPESNLNY